ncbi:MAG: TonB-dependent receptor [Sphingomonas sp.]|nr:TonB-dependent receptor [Sphingomonas sp.]
MFVVAFVFANLLAPPPPDDDDGKPKAAASVPTRDEDQDDEDRAQPSSSIVITAHRLDTARSSVDTALGATVYSVTNDTIENRPGGETGSVANILTQTPGVSLSGKTISVRGSAANQVRINNVIVPEAIADPADLLSSRLAETTRLITGTLPAQFGFAPGGVISITTKNGLYEHGGQAELFGSSDGMIEPAFEWAGSAGATSLFASGDVERERSRIADLRGATAHDRSSQVEGLGFTDHVIDEDNRVSLILGGSHQQHRMDITGIGPGREVEDGGYAVATFQHSTDGFTLQSSIFGAASSDSMGLQRPTRDRRSTVGTQIDGSDQIGGAHTIRFGLLASRSAANELGLASAAHAARTAVAAYAQDDWTLAPSLTFNPGLRVEWLRGFVAGATLEPRGSIVWQRGGFTAHVGYARYASAPPVGEQASAAVLRNERDDEFDAGLQEALGPLTLSMDAYSRTSRHLIVEHETIGSAVRTPLEFNRGRSQGIELSSIYSHGPLSGWANLALASAKARTITGGDDLFAPAVLAAASRREIPLAGSRPVTASAGLTWRMGKLSLSADVLASSGAVRTLVPEQPNGSRHSAYAVLGLAAVYHTRMAGEPTDIRIDLTNLTDVRYVTSDATALEGGWTRYGEGRAVMLGIEQGF